MLSSCDFSPAIVGKQGDQTRLPTISVIIVSYGKGRIRYVKDLINSLAMQAHSACEVIVVIGGSRLAFDTISQFSGTKSLLNTKLIFNGTENTGLSIQRNMAVRKAKGDVLAFIDDDALPHQRWLREIARTFAVYGDAVAVTGPIMPVWENNVQPTWLPKSLHWLVGSSLWLPSQDLAEVRNVWGGNMAIRRDYFYAAGGFMPSLGLDALNKKKGWLVAEDLELSLRLHKFGRILFNSRIEIFHRIAATKLTLSFARKRSFSVGFTRSLLSDYAASPADSLKTEKLLLAGIFAQFPKMFAALISAPKTGWRKLCFTAYTLAFVFLGYLVGMVLGTTERERYSSKEILVSERSKKAKKAQKETVE